MGCSGSAVPAELLDAMARIASYRYLTATEADLQRQLSEAMTREAIAFEPEYQVGAAGRVDFYLPTWRAGLEVKVDGSPSSVLRQLHRYASVAEFDVLVLVTRRARLGGLVGPIGTKPLHVVTLVEGAL